MKAKDIQIGKQYTAKVSGKLTTVRVDNIRVRRGFKRDTTVYDVTNLATGRKTTFASAMKFRHEGRDVSVPRKPAHARKPLTANDIKQNFDVDPKSATDEVAQKVADWVNKEEAAKQPSDPTGTEETATTKSPAATVELEPIPPSKFNVISNTSEPIRKDRELLTTPSAKWNLADRIRQEQRTTGVDNAPHVIVEARAGSGKTTTLICGIAYMFRDRKVV
jgi:DNA segregation ATPase FtsK/SpoIIIE-like protein